MHARRSSRLLEVERLPSGPGQAGLSACPRGIVEAGELADGALELSLDTRPEAAVRPARLGDDRQAYSGSDRHHQVPLAVRADACDDPAASVLEATSAPPERCEASTPLHRVGAGEVADRPPTAATARMTAAATLRVLRGVGGDGVAAWEAVLASAPRLALVSRPATTAATPTMP